MAYVLNDKDALRQSIEVSKNSALHLDNLPTCELFLSNIAMTKITKKDLDSDEFYFKEFYSRNAGFKALIDALEDSCPSEVLELTE